MSFCIIRIEKFKKHNVSLRQISEQREKDYNSTDITPEMSCLNYDLHNSKKVNFHQIIRNRINQLNLKKKLRIDSVLMCQCLITSDYNFFITMSYDETKEFFKKAYKFVCDKYGIENIISAIVHYDQKTPHIHINFVPVTPDRRLCARDLFTRKTLTDLQTEFYEYIKLNGYNLQRGESRTEKRKHLSVEEYKLETKRKELKTLKNELEASMNNTTKLLDNIKVTPIDGGMVEINKDDYEFLLKVIEAIKTNENI